jgi:predicted dienelactone hydrolase
LSVGTGRSWLAVLVAAGAVSACTGGGTARPPAVPPTSSAAPPAPELATTTSVTMPPASPAPRNPYAVGVRTETFVDTARPTPATSAGPATPGRTLPTTIWYPASGDDRGGDVVDAAPAVGAGPFPLVVWGHGFNVRARDYRSLLHRWAQAGYVIAAPDFPASTGGRTGPGAGPATTDDEGSEPGDLSFTASSVLRLSAAPEGLLTRLVDPRRMVAAGHSQGAADALAMTVAQCCRDHRVSAAVIVAGAERPDRFGAYQYAANHTPVLLEQGGRDRYLSVDDASRLYARLSSPKFLLVLRGADHNTPQGDAEDEPTRLLAQVIVDFCDHYVKDVDIGDRLQREVRDSEFADLTEATMVGPAAASPIVVRA